MQVRSIFVGIMGTAVLPILASLLTGCHRGEVLGRVSGRVTFQGEPITEAVVIFRNEEKGVYMTANLDRDGTYLVEMAQGFGLPLGTYHVYLSPPPQEASLGPALQPPKPVDLSKMPERYRNPATSELTLTVKQGQNRFDIDMLP